MEWRHVLSYMSPLNVLNFKKSCCHIKQNGIIIDVKNKWKKYSEEGKAMTRAQELSIEKLENAFLGFYGHAEVHEIKTKNVSVWDDGVVYLQLEVGCIGDEGTMAELFGRNELSVCIGKKGGYFMTSSSKSHYRKTYSSTTQVICKCQHK